MQRPLRPSQETGRRGDVVGRKGRILGFVRHGYGIEEPVDFESIGIKRVVGNLPRDINEQSVIDIESLAGKRRQAGENSHGKKYVMNALKIRLDAVGRRCHQECSKIRCP